MIATAIVSLPLVPAPNPLQPAQIHSTTTPSIAPTLLFYVFVATDAEYSCALEVGALDATSRALLARLYREDFARFGYATEVGASRAAIANNASAGGGAVDPTRVFADDRVGASDFIIGQELA